MVPGQTVRIDASLIPDSEYEVACSVLASSIRLALMDEAKRKDFELWKAKRKEGQHGHSTGDRQ